MRSAWERGNGSGRHDHPGLHRGRRSRRVHRLVRRVERGGCPLLARGLWDHRRDAGGTHYRPERPQRLVLQQSADVHPPQPVRRGECGRPPVCGVRRRPQD